MHGMRKQRPMQDAPLVCACRIPGPWSVCQMDAPGNMIRVQPMCCIDYVTCSVSRGYGAWCDWAGKVGLYV